jgi:hypothetical protein
LRESRQREKKTEIENFALKLERCWGGTNSYLDLSILKGVEDVITDFRIEKNSERKPTGGMSEAFQLEIYHFFRCLFSGKSSNK